MVRMSTQPRSSKRVTARAITVVFIGLFGALAVLAQPVFEGSASLVEGLKSCRTIAASADRATCYDARVGALLVALEAGDVKLIDREQVRKTKRQLFGIPMPDLDIFKGDGKDEEELADLFETTISSGRQTGPATWRFTTAEGAVWEINNPPRKLAPFKPGDKVVFKKASLGYYFVRINGQIGVKGRRIS